MTLVNNNKILGSSWAVGALVATAGLAGCSNEMTPGELNNAAGTAAAGDSAGGGGGDAPVESGGGGTAGMVGEAGMAGIPNTAGMTGSGGTGAVACPPGDPPIVPHNSCTDIPSYKEGEEGFTITSPAFEYCGEMSADLTCDGKAFGTGASPELNWTGAPEGTMSYALVFKDIAILADNDPALDRFAYHWVMWDIPPTTTGLPAGLTGGYESTEVPGALQWASRNEYGYFPPCPNPFPVGDERFSCELAIDSYSYTLYALPVEKLADLPAPDINEETGMPSGNWVVNMGHYIESLDALAVTEHRGTSSAWATSFAPPEPVEYPCTGDTTEACLMSAMGCPEGDPPISALYSCMDIPSSKDGEEGFTVTSPAFDYCGEMSAELTCDGKAFGTGASPELNWTGAPDGTMSYALVFKDIAILAENEPTRERFAYHWVMWDIPSTTTGLPAGLTGGYESTEVPGALQWASRNEYGYFPPCPNPFPADDERFSCELVIDSYSYTLYALPVEKLADLPVPDIDAETGMPSGNWVVNMGHYIESLDALAVTEHRGTSGAWSTSFAPPDPVEYPCSGDTTTGCLGGEPAPVEVPPTFAEVHEITLANCAGNGCHGDGANSGMNAKPEFANMDAATAQGFVDAEIETIITRITSTDTDPNNFGTRRMPPPDVSPDGLSPEDISLIQAYADSL